MMKMRALAMAFQIGLLLHSGALGQTRHTVMPQADSPVQAVAYEAEIWGTGSGLGDGVNHDFRFQNVSDRGVVAVKFGLLCYDIFDEFQDGTEEIVVRDLAPGETTRYTFQSFPPAPSSFYTGLIYVRKVRFLDGEIWEAAPEDLDGKIQAFEVELGPRAGG
jgi:hypothetical protein